MLQVYVYCYNVIYRYTPAELRCLPINTVLDKPQAQSISTCNVVTSSNSTLNTSTAIATSTQTTNVIASTGSRLDTNQRSITTIDTTKVLTVYLPKC